MVDSRGRRVSTRRGGFLGVIWTSIIVGEYEVGMEVVCKNWNRFWCIHIIGYFNLHTWEKLKKSTTL